MIRYASAKNGKIYTEHEVASAFEAFWTCFEESRGSLREDVLPKKPADAWERYLKALKLAII